MKTKKTSARARTLKLRAIIMWLASGLFLIGGSFEPTTMMLALLFAYLGFRSFAQLKNERKAEEAGLAEQEAFNKYIETLKETEINITDKSVPKLDINAMPELVTITEEANLRYDKCSDFIVIAIETTGRSPLKNKVLEFAAVKFRGYEPVEYIATLINSEDLNEGAPTIEEALPSLIDFIGDCPAVVAHNMLFTSQFLYASGFDLFKSERKFYDTLKITKNFFDVENYRLETLCELYTIYCNKERHALSDCLSTGHLFKELLVDIQ